MKIVSTNIGAIRHRKALVQSMSSVCNCSAVDDKLSSMQRVAIVQDKQEGVFVNIVKASGTDQTFKTVYSKLETASKNPAAECRFATGYPHKHPSKMLQGYAKGTFSDLEVLVGVKLNLSGNNNCPTRLSDGLFY